MITSQPGLANLFLERATWINRGEVQGTPRARIENRLHPQWIEFAHVAPPPAIAFRFSNNQRQPGLEADYHREAASKSATRYGISLLQPSFPVGVELCAAFCASCNRQTTYNAAKNLRILSSPRSSSACEVA